MDAPLAKGGLQHAPAQPGSSTVCAVSLPSAVSPMTPLRWLLPSFPHTGPCLSSLFLLLP